MIQFRKETDENREAGPLECCCLHGAVGTAADWRALAKWWAAAKISTRAVDLWRFLENAPLPLTEFGEVFNTDARESASRASSRALLGYSMGGRLALHALLESAHPWQAAVIVSADPGLECEVARTQRRDRDVAWAKQILTGDWPQFLAQWSAQPVLGDAAMRDPAAASNLSQRRREIARSFVDWSLGSQAPLWQRLHEIKIPLLWIVGEEDEKFLKLAQRAIDLIPNANLAVAPKVGHRVPWQHPTWFAERVSQFLKSGH